METFPGGILSSEQNVGVIHVGGTELVAVELSTGAVKWRRKASGRPVAATERYLVVLQIGPRTAIHIYDLQSGEDLATIAETGLPDWVAHMRDWADAIHFTAKGTATVLNIDWQAERRYTGGAAPRSGFDKVHAKAGRLRIDLRTGRSTFSHADDALLPPEPSIEAEPATTPAPLPGEVGRGRAGAVQFILRAEPTSDGGQLIKLDALSAQGHNKLWEANLGEVKPMPRPGPLRK